MHLLYTSVNYLIRTLPQGKANTSSCSGRTAPSMWTEVLARQTDTCTCVCACVRYHVSMRDNGKGGLEYFFAQIRYPRTLLGICALWDGDPITVLPLPTSSHTLPSAPHHSSYHEKTIYGNPCDGSSHIKQRVNGDACTRTIFAFASLTIQKILDLLI